MRDNFFLELGRPLSAIIAVQRWCPRSDDLISIIIGGSQRALAFPFPATVVAFDAN